MASKEVLVAVGIGLGIILLSPFFLRSKKPKKLTKVSFSFSPSCLFSFSFTFTLFSPLPFSLSSLAFSSLFFSGSLLCTLPSFSTLPFIIFPSHFSLFLLPQTTLQPFLACTLARSGNPAPIPALILVPQPLSLLPQAGDLPPHGQDPL